MKPDNSDKASQADLTNLTPHFRFAEIPSSASHSDSSCIHAFGAGTLRVADLSYRDVVIFQLKN